MGRYTTMPFHGITSEQLKDNEALDELLEHARANNWWGKSEVDRMNFYACAERALRLGNNPGKMFTALIKRGLVRNIATQDERRAIIRVRGY